LNLKRGREKKRRTLKGRGGRGGRVISARGGKGAISNLLGSLTKSPLRKGGRKRAFLLAEKEGGGGEENQSLSSGGGRTSSIWGKGNVR